jgi:hypothetical protein
MVNSQTLPMVQSVLRQQDEVDMANVPRRKYLQVDYDISEVLLGRPNYS